MKKPIAILLLIIHSFNLAGYPAMFAYFQHKANNRFISQLDQGNYSDAQLVEVKIPYSLPYSTNWKEYERVYGEMELNGMHYNYVKRKLFNDTLYLLCIPNTEKTNLGKAKHDYINVVNGVAENNTGKKSPASEQSIQKAVGAEYNIVPTDYPVGSGTQLLQASAYNQVQSPLLLRALSTAFQPPDL